ncbi:MAG: histidine--tRNA ligase [Burkholderiales bacterium]|jgi:histidyl-tRNA synthetase|nr:histidine--tRNA ligase [Burkholderiales bacterium]
MEKINAIKGMNDILPSETYIWSYLEQKIKLWVQSYGYENIRMPIVENTKLFTRSIGEVTDIVEKEMYTFIDKLNNDSLTLRPEGTAGCIRAVTQNQLLYNTTQKLWYMGPMFRHERPQKGRYRQFHQLGVEALGFKGPEIDAEIVLMQAQLWQILGLKNIQLQINCLGEADERVKHKQELIAYFEKYKDLLDEDCLNRLYKNPLRILDSKNPQLQQLINEAPQLINYLGKQSQQHYNGWKQYLQQLGINFAENSRLVRGLDYYNLSVFEWVSFNLGAQGTISGGGRYDPLIKQLSGKDNYAIGFGMGMERLILEIQAQNQTPNPDYPDVFIANFGEATQAMSFNAAQQLRDRGYNVIQNLSDGSLKSQLKRANSMNCRITLIIGETEVLNNQIVVKFMDSQEQQVINFDELVNHIK